MNIFDTPKSSDIERSQIEIVEQKRHEYHLVGTMRKRPGHTLFSYNTRTKELKVAKITKCNVYDYQKKCAAFNDKVEKELHCIYLYALNRKNCIKHLKLLGYD